MKQHDMSAMMLFRFVAACIWAASCASAFSNFGIHLQWRTASRAGRQVSTFASMIDLGDSNYEQILAADNKAVLVDACAAFCGPCKLIEPVLDRCADKWTENLDMVKYDVESDNPNVKMELLLQNVMPRSLPSLVLFKNGKAIANRSGVITEEELDSFLEMHLRVKTPKKQEGAGYVHFSDDRDDYMLSGAM